MDPELPVCVDFEAGLLNANTWPSTPERAIAMYRFFSFSAKSTAAFFPATSCGPSSQAHRPPCSGKKPVFFRGEALSASTSRRFWGD